ncbi:hypothetical protein ACFWQL_09775 [Amycolatopsis thermoflava]|uniref:hypothetical protein n=1 Tax=Amycolatopsis thermoflava TaxID=84480 RepID=UPI00365E5FCC
MNVNLTTSQMVVGAAGILLLLMVWRSGARRARKAAERARDGARVVSVAGRVLLMTAGLVGIQWLVFTHSTDTTLRLVALALPDLIAAYVLTRALTVTDLGTRRSRGEQR